MPSSLPFDTIVFEAETLLDRGGPGPAGARSRPGARRLVAALARAGVTVTVRPTDDAAGAQDRLDAGLAESGLEAEGARPAPVPATAAAATGARVLSVLAPRPDGPDRAGDGGRYGDDAGSQADSHADTRPDALADATAGTGDGADRYDGTTGTDGTAGTDRDDRGMVVRLEEGEAVHLGVLRFTAGRVGAFTAAAALVAPLDGASVRAAEERHLALTKPPGSLGRLEALGCRLAGIAAEVPPPVPRPAAVAVFAGDHGVHARGVSPWPQEVTAQMVANFVAGGAAINVLARHADAEVVVVDVGVATEVDAASAASPRYRNRRVRPGTADLSNGPAMTAGEALRALDVGADTAARLVSGGARCLVTGDMGIANTTPAAALIAALGDRPADAVTGRGTGIDDEALALKAGIVARAAARARERHGTGAGTDVPGVLAEVGGFEHAALAGFVVGAAAAQVPVVVDGVIAAAGLLVAARLVPGVESAAIAGHRSVEPGASAVLAALGLDPIVDLGLRLGEGTGAALALPLVESAALVLRDMATFDQAGVTGKGA